MSVPDDPFDFTALLRREAARNAQAHDAGEDDSAGPVLHPSLHPGSKEPIVGIEAADTPAPDPAPAVADAGLRHREAVAPATAISVASKRLTALRLPALRLPRAVDAPLFGLVSGGVAFILILGMIVGSLVHKAPRTSDLATNASGAAKLASIDPQPVAAPAVQETSAASPNATAPASFRNTADRENKIEGSSELSSPEHAAIVPASVKTENPPSELPKPASAFAPAAAVQPIPLPPIPPGPPAAARGASPSRTATETTASLSSGTFATASAPRAEATQPRSDDASRRKREQKPAKAVDTPSTPVSPTAQQGTSRFPAAAETQASIAPGTPPSEIKAAALPRAEATPPRADDASRRNRDQKPSTTVETSSCTAGVLPGSGGTSARAKQVEAQKMCADRNATFMVSVRCLVAAVVCSDYPSERQGKVAQRASGQNRAPSHPANDAKPEPKPDGKADTTPH